MCQLVIHVLFALSLKFYSSTEDLQIVMDRLQPYISVFGDVGSPSKIAIVVGKTALMETSITKAALCLIAVYYCKL